jgi:hypothetical protein
VVRSQAENVYTDTLLDHDTDYRYRVSSFEFPRIRSAAQPGVAARYSPEPVDTCNTPDDAVEVAVAGSYAYVADGSAGLQVICLCEQPTPPQ